MSTSTKTAKKKRGVLDDYGGLMICAALLGFAFYVNKARGSTP